MCYRESREDQLAGATKAEQFRAVHVQFVGEQDGAPERDLKGRLTDLFLRDPNIYRAYLARVFYQRPPCKAVALCLRVQPGTESSIGTKVGSTFASMFSDHEHLDIMFITVAQERKIATCCRPFFSAPPPEGESEGEEWGRQ